MLVLTRKAGERVMIGDDIVITICRIGTDQVRIGIDAPKGVDIYREELRQDIDADLRELRDIFTTKPGISP